MLIGLGTIVAGGGAALGTGAFSTVEAQRSVNVNIIDEDDIADEFVDITLKASDYDSVGLDGEPDNEDISLVANDVTLVFGTDGNKYPPNTVIDYPGLLEIDSGSSGPDFDVTFEVVDSNSTFRFGPDDVEEYETNVSGGGNENVDVELETADGESGNSTEDNGTLTITVEEDNGD
ncbi:hypothetical protein ACLI4R_06420 [Natrialbaceae archaeon A-chndr2]